MLQQRTLPLPVLRPITIGSDPRNGLQLAHASVRPFHCRLERKGDALALRELDGAGQVEVDGARVSTALLRGGERVRIGELDLRVERGEVAPAVVSTRGEPAFHDEFLAVLKQELARAPWFAISIAVHVLLLLAARELADEREEPPSPLSLQASIDDREPTLDEPVTEATELLPEVVEETIELPEPQPAEVEPAAPEGPEDLPPLDLKPLNVRGVGGGGNSGGGDLGTRGMDLRVFGGDLREHLRGLRESGVDLVFLVDTTASMEPFLDAAKKTLDQLISDLADLVPRLRIGMIAYRDRGDEYLVKAVPLGADRYRILNFLVDLRAFGGGDVPEAVLAAVEHAFEDLQWRPNSRRILLLVADAPPHERDLAQLRQRLRAEVRVTGAGATTLSTIFTGGDRGVGRDDEAEKALREIAALGAGEFAFMANPDQIRSQIIGLTLGKAHGPEAERALRARGESTRARHVQTLIERRDTDELIRKLKILPVEPLVVSGLIRLNSPAVARRCLDLLASNDVPPATREAALYVLKKTTGFAGSVDFGRPLAAQMESMTALRQAVLDAYR